MVTLSSATITLLFVMDPLGNVPLFLTVLHHANPRKRKLIILREALIALVILSIFLFFGQYILQWMQISPPALAISGGIILFLIAIRMIFPRTQDDRARQVGEPFIVPLAVPLIAGPSTMTMVMLLANQSPDDVSHWFIALFIAWSITTVILVFADYLRKLLGERGLIAMERLMGMILTTMAVQLFINGFAKVLHA